MPLPSAGNPDFTPPVSAAAMSEPSDRRTPNAPPRQILLPILLFLLTLASITVAGAEMMYLFRHYFPYTVDPDRYALLLQHSGLLADGLIFSFPLLLIFFAHEMGFFFPCEYSQVDAIFPSFIPFPTPI